MSKPATLAELEFLNYKAALEAGDSRKDIVAFFGAVRTRELEEQYAREYPERVPPFETEIAVLERFKPQDVIKGEHN